MYALVGAVMQGLGAPRDALTPIGRWRRPGDGRRRARLARCASTIGAEDRALLAMRYVAGFNATELASAIGNHAIGRPQSTRTTDRTTPAGAEVMDRHNAFERQLAQEIDYEVGLHPPVEGGGPSKFCHVFATRPPASLSRPHVLVPQNHPHEDIYHPQRR